MQTKKHNDVHDVGVPFVQTRNCNAIIKKKKTIHLKQTKKQRSVDKNNTCVYFSNNNNKRPNGFLCGNLEFSL